MSTSTDERISVREACRRRHPPSGTDAYVLEAALSQAEKEIEELKRERLAPDKSLAFPENITLNEGYMPMAKEEKANIISAVVTLILGVSIVFVPRYLGIMLNNWLFEGRRGADILTIWIDGLASLFIVFVIVALIVLLYITVRRNVYKTMGLKKEGVYEDRKT